MVRPGRSEYLVLRRTIAQRGSLRPILTLVGLCIWAALLTVVLVSLPYPVAAIVPLMVLVVTFEVIRPLHFGAERIGRYIQVFYEEDGQRNRPLDDTPAWERVAMSFGAVPGVGGHPLFVPLFLIATIVNLLAVALPAPSTVEWVLLIPHGAFAVWLLASDRSMRRQRELELTHLRSLRDRPLKP